MSLPTEGAVFHLISERSEGKRDYDEGSYSHRYCDSFFIFEEAGSSVESDLRRAVARPIMARDPTEFTLL